MLGSAASASSVLIVGSVALMVLLRALNLENNGITGTIPDQIAVMTQLQCVNVIDVDSATLVSVCLVW